MAEHLNFSIQMLILMIHTIIMVVHEISLKARLLLETPLYI